MGYVDIPVKHAKDAVQNINRKLPTTTEWEAAPKELRIGKNGKAPKAAYMLPRVMNEMSGGKYHITPINQNSY